ncbi:suppressor of fused domain protein [Streptomyces syringium]|uniref:suppressor of fused domain protein n=1 Tax=Streptomyces syringium TaxID=76729 RepID=UPI00343DBCA4
MDEREYLRRFERYRERLDSLMGAVSEVAEIIPRVPEDGPVFSLSYYGLPTSAHITGYSYGLSLVHRPEWGACGRELSITVLSGEKGWAQVPAQIVAALRGWGPFRRGEVLGHVKPYVKESAMNGIIIGEPSSDAIKSVDLTISDCPAKQADAVEILGVYPIHSSEFRFVRENGSEAFWELAGNLVDPKRPPVI